MKTLRTDLYKKGVIIETEKTEYPSMKEAKKAFLDSTEFRGAKSLINSGNFLLAVKKLEEGTQLIITIYEPEEPQDLSVGYANWPTVKLSQ